MKENCEDKTCENSSLENKESWESLNLDVRIVEILKKINFDKPTLVQTNTIILSLNEKKSVIAKAPTGSGKTAAYCIPIINDLINNDNTTNVQCLVLLPTKELAKQVNGFFETFNKYLQTKIETLNLLQDSSNQVINALLLNNPQIILSTPAKILQVIDSDSNKKLILEKVKFLVIDEVDLMFSFGYLDDLKKLENYLPHKRTMQSFLMSATLDDNLTDMKSMFSVNPAILKINEDSSTKKDLVQYYTKTTEFDKFLLAYVIFKLNLIKGKTIIFVNEINRIFRLKLFFEQFGIKSCVLNNELPLNSRLHIIDQFNKNIYTLLIATSDSTSELLNEKKSKNFNNTNNKLKNYKKDEEYNISRGIDFKNIFCILNFDFPGDLKSYIHRKGRTARAGNSGMVLSFVLSKNEFGKHKIAHTSSCKNDEIILDKIIKHQASKGFDIKQYQFDLEQIEAFRYRAQDAFRSITQFSVREARIKEIKNEIFNTTKLKRFFEEKPKYLTLLRHDKQLFPSRVQSHLKRVPNYLLPLHITQDFKSVNFDFKNNSNKKKRNRIFKKKRLDPLKLKKK